MNIISKHPSVFSHVFILASNTREQSTKFASHDLLTKPTCNTLKYGTNAFTLFLLEHHGIFSKMSFPLTL